MTDNHSKSYYVYKYKQFFFLSRLLLYGVAFKEYSAASMVWEITALSNHNNNK